ncbi:DUF4123 domain-containing protein [Ideonella sp. 4Y16]|uniref:DUF4123 domain-containing protein n=1 Tax=Ideonella alba TaxID=2824118 RepID=A0A940YC66_9BURK|nr:DUF4123 domain-containing protein [Ideonella alba]MBQ0930386.1 DUF4123 domain-containing protein [Ideonella alba]MBQ0946259.1 DUF4123 domain-containing protein [Ideonella alba]
MAAADTPLEIAPAQFRAQLWADDRQQVHAVLLGRCLSGLPARLAAAQQAGEIDDFDCLLPGALPPAVQQSAPYLVRLRRESPFTDALLVPGDGPTDWGVLVLSGVRLIALRNHLRALLQARLPDGRVVPLDTLSPEMLRIVLDHADAAQRAAVNGPVGAWALPGPAHWSLARITGGHLEWRQLRLGAGT